LCCGSVSAVLLFVCEAFAAVNAKSKPAHLSINAHMPLATLLRLSQNTRYSKIEYTKRANKKYNKNIAKRALSTGKCLTFYI
jgi:hypothetical protein